MLSIHYTRCMLPRNWVPKLLQKKEIILIILISMTSTSINSLGEPPNWDEIESQQIIDTTITKNSKEEVTQESITKINKKIEPEKKSNEPELNEDALDLARKTYERLLKQKQFQKAITNLEKIPSSQRRRSEKRNYEYLSLFQSVDIESNNQSNLFNEDDELNDEQKGVVKKLYREAQHALIANKKELAQDLLIHVVYIHRRNFKAKRLLEKALDIRTGDYKVENIEDKYWTKSRTYFYGGNYERATNALTTLTFFDKDNPKIYERLGSSYHMSGENKKAVEAWRTAQYLDPNNKTLKLFIKKAEETIKEEKQRANKRKLERQSQITETKNTKKTDKDLQLLGVYANQTQAYSYAQKLKAQGLKGIVEELDNGKWAVKVPKK